ncbi:Secreted effector protein PipB2 [Fundidesulfovibrio magnetotacticus]|uniref:Secreted effector protein PipB2 n=1 Tax=Fundidesulfovibrio magnetotacticus TaxID=2730080 RepID=A0A6V8M1D5_9BACT|nr:DUF2169 domain-containing protein [Fundidesulfovibrio magnetotacticus]GFK95766.1 Secreted effector protein PipB2 [Fundidesulfovibrio magnetotacticus]
MKILKEAHHSPMFLPTALAGRMRLVCTVMVYFGFDDPEAPLPDREMWPEVMKLLPKPPVLDVGLPKPRAEVLAAGKCFAPGGKPRLASQVSISAGGVKKTLDVFGDRRWVYTGNALTGVTDPEPFTVMPLEWERAYGGKADPRNPKGRGMPPGKPGEKPEKPVFLPNVEYHGKLVGSPEDAPEPASFLPLDVMHPERQKRAGTYDDAWKNERWPYYPDDLDPDFFQQAPPDQWNQSFFRGGEAVEIVNMHPERQLVSFRLPQFKPRLFLTRKEAPKAPPEKDTFEEVALNMDTVWLFPEVLRGVAVWRGVFRTERDDMADLRYVYLATEAAGTAPQTLEHYLEAQNRRVAAMKPVAPVIPDANQKVNRELLKFGRVKKDIERIKAQAKGQTPVMPREPAEMAAVNRKVVDQGLATLDKMEAMARDMQDKFGWRAVLDPASFAPRRAQLLETAQKIDQSLAKAAQTKASLTAMKADMKKEMGETMKARIAPEHLAKAGIDPDNLLPDPDDGLGPWHRMAFPFAVQARRSLEGEPALMARLESAGFKTPTLSRAWLGYNAAPLAQEGADWGLPPGPFTIPRGLVLPRFEGRKLTRLFVLPDWPEAGAPLWQGTPVPGSAEGALWLPGPDEVAPVAVAASEPEALLLEQEVGDVCHVLALADPKIAPPKEAAKALKDAPNVLVTAPKDAQERLAPAAPWLPLSDKAAWLPLPQGKDCLEARLQKADLREWVFDALPPAAIGIPEDDPVPAFGPAPPKKRPAIPDIAGLIQAAHAEIKAFHEARFDGFKATMKDVENQAREAMAKHGKDFDQVMAEAKAAPRKPFDQLGEEMAAQMESKRDALKAQGLLTPDKEADITKAAAQARQLGADSEARWQAGQQKLAEAKAKIEAAKKAQGQGVPEDMKARFKEAGMDLDAMRPRTREEVVEMHAGGRSLAQSILAGVDLSGLDLAGADFTACRLTETKFVGARLDGCTFARSMAQNADFSGASLKGARFNQAMLTRTSFAKSNLSGADFHQASFAQADLSGADLSGADLRLASLSKANLTGAVFSGARLKLMAVQECEAKNASFREADMERVLIRKTGLDGADFSDADLKSTQLQQCKGQGVRFSRTRFTKGALAQNEMPGADFTGAQATHLSVRECQMPGADFRKGSFTACRVENSELPGARLRGVSARGTSFPGSNLEGADLSGSDFLFGSFAKARIVAADLRGASCFGVDFHKAVVGKTRFDGTNLTMTALHGKADLLE